VSLYFFIENLFHHFCLLHPSLCEFVCVFCQGLNPKFGVESRHSEDIALTSDNVLPQCSVAAAAGCTSRTDDGGGILESIERRGGSVAVDVDFLAVVQRIFTRTLSSTE